MKFFCGHQALFSVRKIYNTVKKGKKKPATGSGLDKHI